MTSKIYENLNNNKKSLCLFLDLQKAFDTVNHTKLLRKIENAGITGLPYLLLKDYLSNRQQKTKIQNVTSEVLGVTSGVPQGTVLGPLLFLIYVNDLCNLPITGTLVAFADDTALLFAGESWDEVYTTANDTIQRIKHWLDCHKLSLNIEKTKYITFSCNEVGQPVNKQIIIHTCTQNTDTPCSCAEIEKTENIKYLGIIIDQHMRWDLHANITANRIRRTAYKIKQLRSILNIEQLKQVYSALTQSIAQYSILVWGGTYPTHLDPVIKALKLVIRIALNLPSRYPSDALYQVFPVPTLHHLYAKSILFLAYEMKSSGTLDINHGYGTRHRHQGNFHQIRIHKTIMKHSPQYLAAKLFNKLPENIKTLNTRKKYTTQIKTWLKNTNGLQIIGYMQEY